MKVAKQTINARASFGIPPRKATTRRTRPGSAAHMVEKLIRGDATYIITDPVHDINASRNLIQNFRASAAIRGVQVTAYSTANHEIVVQLKAGA